MDIKSSLVIEDREVGRINLILSGSFVDVYNQSFYLLTEKLGKQLKAKARYVKSANHRFVVSGGFPAYRVAMQYPTAVQTDWGFQIYTEFDTSGYAQWLLRHKEAAQAVENAVAAVAASWPSSGGQGAVTSPKFDIEQKTDKIPLFLTQQQVQYLLSWQKNNYPIEVDFGFIESLKQQLTQTTTSSD